MTTRQQPRDAEGPFDPAAGLFVAQAARPAGLEAVAVATLTPLQRALLVIDGTVTTFLEAWALEPVGVTRLWQRPTALVVADAWLDAPAGTAVLERAVLLTGDGSGSFFAFAESVIVTGRLSGAMRQRLETSAEGLGQILLTSGFESRREGLWWGYERRADLPPAVAAVADGEFLTRTYRVTAGGLPLMLITERFPWRPAAARS